MRLNNYSSRQYIVISILNIENEEKHPEMTFFDSKEDFDELKDDIDEVIIFEGYADIHDVEIYDHPDFELFIKDFSI